MKKQNSRKGFSLIEVIVVVFIFSVMTTISVFNYRNFDNSIALKNQAMDVALSIKEAQANALSARESSAGSNEFRYAYGIFFDRGQSTTSFVSYINRVDNASSTLRTYWFNDANFNCSVTPRECLRKYTLLPGYTISAIYATSSLNVESSINTVSIVYERPEIMAIIRKVNVSGASNNQDSTRIAITSPQNKTVYVYVTRMGQIYIK